MTKPHIQIIVGTDRLERASEGFAQWALQQAGERDDMTFELVDLQEWNLPFLNNATPPMMGNYNEVQQQWADKIAEADGYLIVTAEYNHGYPAVLKNAIDLINAEWARKPVGFVSYGSAAGGSRAVEQLRQVVAELNMASVRNSVHFPNFFYHQAEALEELRASQNKALASVYDDLAWWSEALKTARTKAAAEQLAPA